MGIRVSKSIESAVADQKVTTAEAKDIINSANGVVSAATQKQVRGLMTQKGVAFDPVARRVLNEALPARLRPDAFDWGNRVLTPAEKLWQLYLPNEAPPTDRGTLRLLQVLTTVVNAGDNRSPFWDVECLLRLYKTEYSKENRKANGLQKAPEFDQAYAVVKELEDAIGKSIEPGTPAEQQARTANVAKIRADKWTAGPDGKMAGVGAMVKALSAHEFTSDAEDDTLLKRAVFRQVKKIGTDDFHMDELQGDRGIHELRRQLRWSTYNPRVVGMNGGPSVSLPPELVNAFSQADGALGGIKGRGEEAEEVARQLIEQNPKLTFEQARAQATTQLGPSYDPAQMTQEANAVYQGVKDAYQKCAATIEAGLA